MNHERLFPNIGEYGEKGWLFDNQGRDLRGKHLETASFKE